MKVSLGFSFPLIKSSYGTFSVKIGNYPIAWFQDLEHAELFAETLETHLEGIKDETSGRDQNNCPTGN